MTPYRIVALSDDFARAVRTTRTSPQYGHPVHVELANGHGPCRQCLRTFAIGKERRILFTYDPFEGNDPLPLPGPVFIHEAECRSYPEDSGFPGELRGHRLTFGAYGRGRRLRAEERVEDGNVDPIVERLLARSDVDYIHVRDTRAGCFDFTIERVHLPDRSCSSRTSVG